ncbi:MAG: hypothetical protein ACYTFZ_10080 [Planctomycetota bacterium]
MKHKSTLLLFIAVIIAGLVAYSLSRKPTSHELQKQRRNLLTDFDSSKIETLQIQQGDLRLTCRRATRTRASSSMQLSTASTGRRKRSRWTWARAASARGPC